jgi:hypothetical protein
MIVNCSPEALTRALSSSTPSAGSEMLDGTMRISAYRASQQFDVKLWTLCHAIDNGTVRGEVKQTGARVRRTVDDVELAEDLARLAGRGCTYPGCGEEALLFSERCLKHTGNVLQPGHAPAGSEERARMDYGRLGVERPDVAERYRDDWDKGGPLTLALMYTPAGKSKGYFKPETREKYGPKWAPSIAERRGKKVGRGRALSPDEDREVWEDHRLGITQEALAERYGVSRDAVRGSLARSRRGEVSPNL